MNRELVKRQFRNDVDAYGKPKKIMTKIDEIYEDFETRICENCKFNVKSDKKICSVNIIRPYSPYFSPNGKDVFDLKFGCNEFERSKPFALILGRFQPFHKGHEYLVYSALELGYEPIILLGSPNKNDKKNPLTFEERCKLIQMIFPEIKIYGIEDYDNWDKWLANISSVIAGIPYKPKEIKVLNHIKEDDKTDFSCNGIEYKNEHYSKVFEQIGIDVLEVPEFNDGTDCIHATTIREDKTYARNHLDKKMFNYLDKKTFWS